MRHLSLLALLLAGCGSSPLQEIPDAGTMDAGAADLAVEPADLGSGPMDLSTPTDIASGPDLAIPRFDLSATGDLSAPELALRFLPFTRGAYSGLPFSAQVEVVDANTGSLVSDVFPVISLSLGAATNPKGVLSGSVPRLPTNGVAQFDGLSIDRWGQYTLIATAPGFEPGESMPIQVDGSQAVFLVQPSDVVAHQTMTPVPEVALEDTAGDTDLLANVPMRAYAEPPLGCGIPVALSAQMTNGVATFDNVVVDKACTGYHLLVQLGPGSATSAPFDVEVGAPVGLVLGPPATALVRGTPFDLPVEVVDAGKNLVPSASATVALGFPSAVSWTGPSTVDVIGGSGVFSGVVVDTVGNLTATATAPGLTPASSTFLLTAWELRSKASLFRLFVDPQDPEVVYATGSSIRRSSDGGKTFNEISPWSTGDLAFDPTQPTTIYVAGWSGVLKATDGATFTLLDLPSDNYLAVAVDPHAPETVWAVASGAVWRSPDGGATWNNLTPVGASNLQGLAIDPVSGAVYLGGSTIRKSSDDGATWSVGAGLPANTGFSSISIDPTTPNRVYACGSSYCYASSDGGSTWSALTHGGYRIVIDPTAHDILYLVDGSFSPWKSRDGGATWMSLPFPAGPASDIAIAASSTQELYAMANGAVYRTLTGGE